MASTPKRRTSSALLLGILAVVFAVLLILFVLRLARQPGAKVNLGSQEFSVGRADKLAAAIQRARTPLLFQALRHGAPDLFVQHVGSDPEHGWVAFAATAPGESRSCQLRWLATRGTFTDPCSGRTFGATGDGLDQYAVRVDPARTVIVNLRQPIGTTPPSQ
jgi:hypothetical protein